MATRASSYRSHSPTPTSTPAPYETNLSPQSSAVSSMALESRNQYHHHAFEGRGPEPFYKNMVVGSGAPVSPRHAHYTSPTLPPISPPREFNRNQRSHPIPEHEAMNGHRYGYDSNGYSDFSQSKPPAEANDTDGSGYRQLPAFTSPVYHSNGKSAITLPPINNIAYQQSAYSSGHDSHRRQLSIQSMISSVESSSPRYGSFPSIATHGNGTLKKRKKSFGDEDGGSDENVDGDDRERERQRLRGPEGGSGNHSTDGMTMHKSTGVGLEDPAVRIAAEALGDLRADFNYSGMSSRRTSHLQLSTASGGSSSSSANTTNLSSPLSPIQQASFQGINKNSEGEAPLLDLIQNNPNPVLRAASAAGRLSAVAYTSSKAYSPRFKAAAESVESVALGQLGGAVGSLVSTVGKRSGLEGLVRRSLGGAQLSENENIAPSEASRNANANATVKKRKTSNDETAAESSSNHGSGNVHAAGETQALQALPKQSLQAQEAPQQQQQQQQQQQTQNWQTRLILSTTSSIAMSEDSLKSLKYCLDWLRWANNHLSRCIETLKNVLEEYERHSATKSSAAARTKTSLDVPNGLADASVGPDEHQRFLIGRIEVLKKEVLKTLQKVITVIDSYAGGALVGETRAMVKRQLLHLPKRLQIALVPNEEQQPASTSGSNDSSVATTHKTNGQPDPAQAAQRVMIVAREGLEMMGNISRLVNTALSSAEGWCEKLGKNNGNNSIKPQQQVAQEGQQQHPQQQQEQQAFQTNGGTKSITMGGDKDVEGDVKMD